MSIRFEWLVLLLVMLVSCGTEDKKVPEEKMNPSLAKLQIAQERYPDSALLAYQLLEAYRDEGMYHAAIKLVERQIKRDTGNAHLWNIRGTLFFEMGDTLEAANSLEHAIAIYPLPEYLVALGTVYAEIRNPNSLMIAEYLLRGGNDKYYDDAYFIKGLYFNFTQNFPRAIQSLDSALALDFNYMYAYREKAIALYQIGKYQEALKVLDRALTFQNSYDEGYYWMGRVYEKLDKKQKAIESYQNALLYDKHYVQAREALKRLGINVID